MIRISFFATHSAGASSQGSKGDGKTAVQLLSLRVLWLASVFFFFFVPLSFAEPFQLCVSLSDSSGHATGTQNTSCDQNLVGLTLTSSTFGTYVGSGRASSDSFDTVRLFADADLIDYQPGSYVALPGGGIAFAAVADARYRDLIRIQGPNVPAILHVTYDLSGSLISQGASAQFCFGFALGAPVSEGTCLPSGTLPSEFTVDSSIFTIDGSEQALNASFSAVVFNTDSFQLDVYSASGTADLEHTITLQELLVTTPDGQPINGVTLISSNDFDYPLSSLNQPTQPPSSVPEPSTWLLLASGMAWLFARRRVR